VGDYALDVGGGGHQGDLIFEAVAEDFDVKREMYEKIDTWRREGSIVCSVTSGLSINDLASHHSEDFQKHFLGLHFFNPPNVIVGTELIASKDTDPGLLDFIEVYSEKKLGRTMIRTHDTAGFAGNRVGFKVLNECAILAEEHGPALMDKIVASGAWDKEIEGQFKALIAEFKATGSF